MLGLNGGANRNFLAATQGRPEGGTRDRIQKPVLLPGFSDMAAAPPPPWCCRPLIPPARAEIGTERPLLLPGSRFRRWHPLPPWCAALLMVRPGLTRPSGRNDQIRRSVLLPGSFGHAAASSSSLRLPHLIPPVRRQRATARRQFRKPLLLPGFSALRRRHPSSRCRRHFLSRRSRPADFSTRRANGGIEPILRRLSKAPRRGTSPKGAARAPDRPGGLALWYHQRAAHIAEELGRHKARRSTVAAPAPGPAPARLAHHSNGRKVPHSRHAGTVGPFHRRYQTEDQSSAGHWRNHGLHLVHADAA